MNRSFDDVILNILYNLEDEPRNWARIACVSTRFSSLIRTVCCKTKCSQAIPAVVADLLPSGASVSGPPGGWASLYKLAVCCPGLVHSGVLLENSDFRIENEIGPDEDYQENKLLQLTESEKIASPSCADHESSVSVSAREWSLYDDLLFDTLYNHSESLSEKPAEMPESTVCKRRKICRSFRSHLASGAMMMGSLWFGLMFVRTVMFLERGRIGLCIHEAAIRGFFASNSIGAPLCEVLSTLDEELEWLKSPKAYSP
ncbi:UNVERIFIED_CONTAM: Phytochrome A-associated F-box protein [Sesamum angustifolium]|uniref:Phytochrome A-associated F-box protein n=1 Tax=Sesamum angustifolium TaxID=2727405 RepID=A0AAW2QSJ6_9LAMI